MSSIRQRAVPFASTPVDTVQKLSAALKQVKESASAKGITEDIFSQCLTSVAQKKLKPPKEKPKSKSTPNRSCCSRLYMCFKVVWIAFLVILALCMLTIVYKPAGFLVHKIVHAHVYTITRPIRMGIASVLPYMRAVGLDVFSTDCLIENPLLRDADSCPCLSIKESIELELNDTHRVIPEGILTIPNPNVYVLRNAVNMSGYSLSSFEQYRNKLMPDSCFEMTSEQSKGVQTITDLFDSKVVERYLEAPEPWSFNWQECPTEENPLTYRSLLPQTDWLPHNVEMSDSTYFSLSSKWARTACHQDTFEGGRFVAVLALLGDIRVLMDPANSVCFGDCMSFRKHPVLHAGDLLIFDQTFWGYMAVTWTRVALTSTVALKELETG